MTVTHKRIDLRCHFCNKFRHIQQNCREQEKKSALEQGGPSSYQSKKTKHTVNSVNTRSDEVGLVFQHALSNKQADTQWIIDLGATYHVCDDRSLFTELQNLKKPLDIILGDSRTLKATGCGTVILMLESVP